MTADFWNIKLFSIRKTEIYLHFITVLTILWAVYQALTQDSYFMLLFVLAVFFREAFRHILALILRIKVGKLILMPIGFYADEITTTSKRRTIIFYIAGIIFSFIFGFFLLSLNELYPNDILKSASYANFSLAFIHILPIFPLDCHQFLLSLDKTDESRPQYLKRLEFISCLIVILFGFFSESAYSPLILFLFLFPTFLYRMEEQTISCVKDYQCKDAMQPLSNIHPIQHNTTISAAINTALKIPQSIFSVMNDGNFIGVIERNTLFEKATDPDDSYVAQIVMRELNSVTEDTPLQEALDKLKQFGTPLLVKKAGLVIGILTKAAVSEFIRVREIQRIVHDSDNFIDDQF